MELDLAKHILEIDGVVVGALMFASTTPTSHSASYQVSVSPAACALRGASPATAPAA